MSNNWTIRHTVDLKKGGGHNLDGGALMIPGDRLGHTWEITVLEDGEITEEFYSLVNPEQRFDPFIIRLTGITPEAVENEPTFPELWETIGPILSDGVLVAHNAPFDLGVLKKCLRGYGIEWRPQVKGLCTVRMGRRLLPGISHRLGDMCEYYGIDLYHHRADSDSLACAAILIRYMEAGADPGRYVRYYTME